MIGLYLDECVDPSFEGEFQGVFVTGGLLARGETIFELTRLWGQLLKRPDIDIAFFKASQFNRPTTKEFKKFAVNSKTITTAERDRLDSIWNEFLNLIVELQVAAYGFGVVQNDFYEVIKDHDAKAILGPSPFWFSCQAAIILSALEMKTGKTGQTVAVVYDKDQEHSADAQAVYCGVKKKNPESAQYLGSFTHADDIGCPPLQAADAIVYEIRQYLRRHLGMNKQPTRWQFQKLADSKRILLIKYADKKLLNEVVEVNKPDQPLNLDSLCNMEDSSPF